MKYSATIALIVALSALSACGSEDEKLVELPKDVAPSTEVKPTKNEANPSAKSARQVARLSGTLEPAESGVVAANVNGLIREVYVEEGDQVEKGDKLVNIDSADYRLRVRQAKAALESAKAQRDTLKVEYDRTRQLLSRKAVAQSAFDQLSGQLSAANAGVKQAEVALDMAQKAQRDSLVRAPFDGVVTKLNATPGSFAAAGPSPLMELDGTSTLELRIAVPETYAGRIAAGTSLRMKVPATGHEEQISVTRINPVVNRSTRSFDVIATLENPSDKVLPGMFAEVALELGDAQ